MFVFVGALALAAVSANAASHPKTPAPTGSIKGVFRNDDYPQEALEKDDGGDVGTLIRVDRTGAVSDCIVEKSSGSALLDKRTCDVIRERAKLKPARDRKGRPVAGEMHETIKWRIAKDMVPSDPWAVKTVIEFGPYGDAVSCRVEAEGAMQPKSGYRPHSCSSLVMNRDVSGEARFGGPIDRVIMDKSFAAGALQMPPLGADEELSGREVYLVEIDAAGKVTSCNLTERTGPPGAADPCPALNNEFVPRKGVDGKFAPFTATEVLTGIVHIDRSRAPRPTPLNGSLQGLITGDDYPDEALDRGDQGEVDILIRTDPKGTVRDCIVEKSSGSPILDRQTCAVARQRAKFKPAVDRQGSAVAGEYRTRVEWLIAEDRPPSDPWTSRTIITFAPDGRPLSCRIELEGAMKPPPGMAAPACSADEMANAPPKMTDLPGVVGTVVMEQIFASKNPPPPVAAGDILVSRQVVSLDINAEGHLISCKVIEHSSAAPDSDACATIDREYLPRPGPDGWPVPFTATETISVYVHVEKVALSRNFAGGRSSR